MRFLRWLIWLFVILLILAALGYGAIWMNWLQAPAFLQPWLGASTVVGEPGTLGVEGGPALDAEGNPIQPAIPTTPVRKAEDFIANARVSGKLEYRTIKEVLAPYEENVESVAVNPGDEVQAGALIATLDRDTLSSQLDERWLALTKERQAFSKLVEGEALALQEANAKLLAAQEGLNTKLKQGQPSAADTQNAQVALSEAQLKYDQLLKRNDPNSKEVREARFALREAERTVQRAQISYDAVSWKGADPEVGPKADALQSATLGMEKAQIAYDEAIKPPTDLEIQQAQLAISKAQSEYDKLFVKATASEIEQAKVDVAKAQNEVDKFQNGEFGIDVQEAESKVLKALSDFESVRNKLLNASALQSPIDGLVVRVAAKPGQLVKAGDVVARVAVPNQFNLTLQVGENNILRIQEGMEVSIALDVLPDDPLTGTVTGFAPITVQTAGEETTGSSGNTVATFPVIVEVADSEFSDDLRPGMSALVTFLGSNQLEPDSWLVPQNAIQSQEGDQGTIQVMRDGSPVPLEVTVTDQTQADSVVVISTELTEDDEVVGSTASFPEEPPGPFGP